MSFRIEQGKEGCSFETELFDPNTTIFDELS